MKGGAGILAAALAAMDGVRKLSTASTFPGIPDHVAHKFARRPRNGRERWKREVRRGRAVRHRR